MYYIQVSLDINNKANNNIGIIRNDAWENKIRIIGNFLGSAGKNN